MGQNVDQRLEICRDRSVRRWVWRSIALVLVTICASMWLLNLRYSVYLRIWHEPAVFAFVQAGHIGILKWNGPLVFDPGWLYFQDAAAKDIMGTPRRYVPYLGTVSTIPIWALGLTVSVVGAIAWWLTRCRAVDQAGFAVLRGGDEA